MAKDKEEIGSARPSTIPALVCAGSNGKKINNRRVAGRSPSTMVAGMSAAEALNTGKRRNYKRIPAKS